MVTEENAPSGSCYEVLTLVKISCLLPYHIDVYCVNKNAFRGTACAHSRAFANINIRTPKPPIPLNRQNFCARWTFKPHLGRYSTQLPQWPKRSVMEFWARDSSKRFKTSTYFRESEMIRILKAHNEIHMSSKKERALKQQTRVI